MPIKRCPESVSEHLLVLFFKIKLLYKEEAPRAVRLNICTFSFLY